MIQEVQLLSHAQQEIMQAHWVKTSQLGALDIAHDPKPVVRLFTPDANATWLLTELSPDCVLAFGLCDLGVGFPELGFVSLVELQTTRGPFGLPIERDMHFSADKPLSAYSQQARCTPRVC